ncbi:MAG: nucleoside hydrolase [Pseudomonadota bacterium]
MKQHKLIIDTDPGVDDAMAILYAILDPEINLVGLTSIFGNVTIDVATRNTLRLVEMAGVSVPVARGADRPLIQPLKQPATEVHGEEGFGDVPAEQPLQSPIGEPAHEFICRMIHENPGEIILCPVGPLTNIALALDHDPTIAQKVKSITVMGGSVEEGGNVTEFAEANIWQDPHAADKVFAAPWPVTLIGLDVTHQIVCTQEDFAGIAEISPKLGGFLDQAVRFYINFHQKDKRNPVDGCHMHDPSAVISIVDPGLFSIDEKPLCVILEGEKLGQTIPDESGTRQPVKVAMQVDGNGVRDRFSMVIGSGT